MGENVKGLCSVDIISSKGDELLMCCCSRFLEELKRCGI